jgi:hypothetical protein
MGICVIGLLITDIMLILVVYLNPYLPGGYWFLLVGSVIEGALGGQLCLFFCPRAIWLTSSVILGLTSAVAVTHTYISDTSTPDTRSRVLSLNLGLLFLGMAIGPTFGSMVINLSGTIMSVFFLATAVHFLYSFIVWLILPESRTKKQMHQSKLKYAEELSKLKADRALSQPSGLLIRLRRLFSFLSPLTIFSPIKVHDGNPLKRHRRDWNLTIVAVAYGVTISLMVCGHCHSPLPLASS